MATPFAPRRVALGQEPQAAPTAQAANVRTAARPAQPQAQARPSSAFAKGREAASLLLFTSAVFITLSLASFMGSPVDATVEGRNWVGPVGSSCARALVSSVGVIAWAAPAELLMLAWPLLKNRASIATIARLAGDVLVLLVLAALVQVALPGATSFGDMPAAGSVGELFGELMRSLFSTVGSFLIGLTAIGLILIGRASFSFIQWFQRASQGTEIAAARAKSSAKAVADAWGKAAELRRKQEADLSQRVPEVHEEPALDADFLGDWKHEEPSPGEVKVLHVDGDAPSGLALDTPRPAPRKAAPRKKPSPTSTTPPAAGVEPQGRVEPETRVEQALPPPRPDVEDGAPARPRRRSKRDEAAPTKAPDDEGDDGPGPTIHVGGHDAPSPALAPQPASPEPPPSESPAPPVAAPVPTVDASRPIEREPVALPASFDDEPSAPPAPVVPSLEPPPAPTRKAPRDRAPRPAERIAPVEAPLPSPSPALPPLDDDTADEPGPPASDPSPAPPEPSPEPSPVVRAPAPAPRPAEPPRAAEPPRPEADKPAPPRIVENREVAQKVAPRPAPRPVARAFDLPTPELLYPPEPNVKREDAESLRQRAKELEKVLANYGVKGVVADIHTGPTVSTFELIPAEGTKVRQVASLDDDLALGLSCKVRIVAPIPGKNRIGFELPNRDRIPVNLRELVEDRRFQEMNAPLPVVMGRDIVGSPFFADLSTLPHVIVAGSTGAGKSVGLNVMLISLLLRRTPEQLRLLMVDPKVVELAPFDRIPHLLLPVVTDMKQAATALKWAVDEMERRYQLFANAGTKNIGTYNGWVDRVHRGEVKGYAPPKPSTMVTEDGVVVEAGPEREAPPLPEKLPYIVIVVDEFADLMMQQGKDVEASIARLAQKARAAGMHVILATQRPSTDVITGTIKSNFPSRIAFRVVQWQDSKTILDEKGAEQLLGRGDMLVKLNGMGDTKRVQGPFVFEEEVQAVTDHLRAQGEPVYDENILKARDDEDAPPEEEEEIDPKFDEAVRIVAETQRCSTSWLQRKMGLGYNRAAKLVEMMERKGIVGPANGSKDREVLISPQ